MRKRELWLNIPVVEEEEEEEEDSGGFGQQQTAAGETHCGIGGSTQSSEDCKKTDDGTMTELEETTSKHTTGPENDHNPPQNWENSLCFKESACLLHQINIRRGETS